MSGDICRGEAAGWHVDIEIELEIGTRHEFSWDISAKQRTKKRSFTSAVASAMQGSREELSKAKAHGRSKIRAVTVRAYLTR